LIEIGLLVLEKIFFNLNTCKYGFPYCGPSRPSGTMMWTILNYIISESFHINMIYSGSVVLEKMIFKWPHPIFAVISSLKRTWPFIWIIRIPFTQGWFIPSLIEIGLLVLEKIFFQYKHT
jgi:hypothetical protein